jgi:hypothetical protein
MESKIPKLLLQAIGLKCCEVRIGLADSLCFGLGEKVYYDSPRLQGKFHGEWDFCSYSSSWRILRNKLLCGSYDSPEESEPRVRMLLGEQLTSILQPTPYDLTFLFTNGIEINLFGQSAYDEVIRILAPKDRFLEFKDGQWNESSSNEPAEGLTAEEEIISEYSRLCHERWTQVIPKRQEENQCKNCAYFRAISGKFHFWDYGLCSHNLSEYDGKVVGVNSGCNCFNIFLP